MSVENITKALNLKDHRLTPAMRLLIVGIANHDGDGGAFPKVATLARYVGVSERQIQKQLSKLEEIGRIRREVQEGGSRELPDFLRPNRYFVDYDSPSPPPPVPQDTGCPTGHPPGGLQDTPPGGLQDTPEPSLEPNVKPSNLLSDLESAPKELFKKTEVDLTEEIYKAYPRKVGKPAALKAIIAAIKTTKISPPDLLAKTKEFALASQGKEEHFIPHPATWFNQHRFADPSPSTSSQNGNPTPHWLGDWK